MLPKKKSRSIMKTNKELLFEVVNFVETTR
nr:MAG TPA: hypothetical protein [Caudoviricetes sp.]